MTLTNAHRSYYCNKCGSFPDAVFHNRPDGSKCPYIARVAETVAPPVDATDESKQAKAVQLIGDKLAKQ